MPQAVFVLHLDDYKGFIVAKRYPSTFGLNERILNLVFMEHGDAVETVLKLCDVEGRRIATFGSADHPRWLVCFVLGTDEDFAQESKTLSGMGRLILEIVVQLPDLADIGEILRNRVTIEEMNEEQNAAKVFLIPSAGILLDKMQSEGVIKARNLEMWMKSQIQSEDISLRDVVTSMMKAGILKVEYVGRDEEAKPPKAGAETVFLVRDLFGYRAPPVKSLDECAANQPAIFENYKKYVEGFFANYNPTLSIDDPTSSGVEDRTRIAKLISHTIDYTIVKQLRERPMSVKEMSKKTLLPAQVIQDRMWKLESERLVTQFEDEGLWALISNPTFETFMPEYVLPIVAKKHAEEQLDTPTAERYLELLMETWGEQSD